MQNYTVKTQFQELENMESLLKLDKFIERYHLDSGIKAFHTNACLDYFGGKRTQKNI
ncbi:hypothetical protein [Algoriphagus sp. NG3]|uniref:hypothetical protein n=1 Tax=Algoriphagus sp. NG3 TaxID=3097546 RepID=UPI002A8184DC|nr:hypothetical protein [Algoriphagus sp. NG3]WPR77715.1 hypothetical protein SLW71_10205 [Algoriphagus sp. NG3]